jgi:hypothetical protein
MSRSVLLIGNGLGMALKPEPFSLPCVRKAAWCDPECLSTEQKKLIASCVNSQGEGNQPPKGEDDTGMDGDALKVMSSSGAERRGGHWPVSMLLSVSRG